MTTINPMEEQKVTYSPKVITSNSNELVKRVAALSVRPRDGMCVVQGNLLVQEALAANLVDILFISENSDPAPYEGKCKVVLASFMVMDKLAGVYADQGMVALIKLPEKKLHNASRIIVLDGVQDPGNAGSIARTAHALGYDGMALLPGAADPSNPRMLAASKGAVFHLPIERFKSVADFRQKINLPLIGTSSLAEAVDLAGFTPPPKFALVFGQESVGMSPELAKACAKTVRIAQLKFDSLNVAASAAIIAYDLLAKTGKKVV